MTNFYDYWFKLGKWNTEQAALLFNGKDPSQCGGRVKFPQKIEDSHKLNRHEWQREAYRTYSILELADDWRKYVDTKSDPYFYFEHPKEASPDSFMSLAVDKGIKIPEKMLEMYLASFTNTHPMRSSGFLVLSGNIKNTDKADPQDVTVESDEKLSKDKDNCRSDTNDYEEAFDPLPLAIIAKMFPLKHESDENQNRWKYLSGKATKNGLVKARVKVGKGKAQSTFNPYLVGCWVTTIRDGLTPDYVNRKLSSNLPSRSVHLKDETFV